MQLDKKTIYTVLGTLVIGLALGAILFGGNSTENQAESLSAEHSHEHNEAGLWTCSMHPQVRQEEPGSCPFCGMDLIPVADAAQDDNPRVLKMSNSAIALANIQTQTAGSLNADATLVLNGRIKADQRLVQSQTTHFPGRIEKLYKDFEGEYVRKGERVASIYSPELVAAQNELLEAKKLSNTNPTLLEAARRKLKYWKVTDEQIKQIEESGEVMQNFDLLSNYNGVITKKLANNGAHLMQGQTLYQIADLSTVWAVFEVYEKDLSKVKIGDKIQFKPNGSPTVYESTVSFISPSVEANSRIIEVRADVRNRNEILKPDMFIKAQLSTSQNADLVIPRSAVLWTGKRSVTYVKSDDENSFELREVELGEAIGNNYHVLSGLSAGEEVVTNGAFTLDAESQLKGKISMMTPSSNNKSPETGFKEVEIPQVYDFKSSTSKAFQNQLNAVAKAYIPLKDAMVEGNAQPIRDQAEKVKASLSKVDMSLVQGDAHIHWMALLTPMEESLEKINNSDDRDEQRLQFINLSKALINALDSFGNSGENMLYVQYCPMANDDKGATWVSMDEEIINPYFGDMMLHCGNVEYTIENN
ncbi:MAG: efflux RND transporter periplasmic adaptor subunit [Roseivirga sp.]|uniref:efflux RND transporter periplasmic adaptor subunit n=1 Tax=Roseivirga sp. TaxID=1964215 RepID=UPI001B13ACA3|nr:efflux RND transporter periplasmic adaptor subunit [Roseivirga sp.]MBO6494690.1 efflux RND transporter periplasmic adaptor subunit [Roseivirga sp.]